VMSGSVINAAQAADAQLIAGRVGGKGLISHLSVTAPNQVQLRVKIAEVSRSVLKRFGVNMASALSIGAGALSLNSGAPFIKTPFTFLDPSVSKTFLTHTNDTNAALFNFNNGTIDANAMLDALDREGLITILAEPNLTAVSGETAQFLAGGEFPIITPGSNGNVSVTFKTFGVSLAFTPTVVNGNRISLKVRPEVSQLTSTGAVQVSGFFIPALTTRRTETVVELASGQSFAIAGLLQNNINRNVEKFPGLADLPILGPLFRSDRFERNETELVIIVTPYIVRPISVHRLALPTDGLIAPTDQDRIAHSRLYRQNPIRGRRTPWANGGGPVGAAGFVLD
jgi:pilus assembly protein CpaC